MEVRRDRVLSCLLSKFPGFRKIHERFDPEIVLFTAKLVEQIDLFVSNVYDIREFDSLVLDLDDAHGPFEDKPSGSWSSAICASVQDEDDERSDPNYVEEAGERRILLEERRDWNRMEEIAFYAIKHTYSKAQK